MPTKLKKRKKEKLEERMERHILPLQMEGQAEGRRRDKCHPGTRRNSS
jgi:hypothetical protein